MSCFYNYFIDVISSYYIKKQIYITNEIRNNIVKNWLLIINDGNDYNEL